MNKLWKITCYYDDDYRTASMLTVAPDMNYERATELISEYIDFEDVSDVEYMHLNRVGEYNVILLRDGEA